MKRPEASPTLQKRELKNEEREKKSAEQTAERGFEKSSEKIRQNINNLIRNVRSVEAIMNQVARLDEEEKNSKKTNEARRTLKDPDHEELRNSSFSRYEAQYQKAKADLEHKLQEKQRTLDLIAKDKPTPSEALAAYRAMTGKKAPPTRFGEIKEGLALALSGKKFVRMAQEAKRTPGGKTFLGKLDDEIETTKRAIKELPNQSHGKQQEELSKLAEKERDTVITEIDRYLTPELAHAIKNGGSNLESSRTNLSKLPLKELIDLKRTCINLASEMSRAHHEKQKRGGLTRAAWAADRFESGGELSIPNLSDPIKKNFEVLQQDVNRLIRDKTFQTINRQITHADNADLRHLSDDHIEKIALTHDVYHRVFGVEGSHEQQVADLATTRERARVEAEKARSQPIFNITRADVFTKILADRAYSLDTLKKLGVDAKATSGAGTSGSMHVKNGIYFSKDNIHPQYNQAVEEIVADTRYMGFATTEAYITTKHAKSQNVERPEEVAIIPEGLKGIDVSDPGMVIFYPQSMSGKVSEALGQSVSEGRMRWVPTVIEYPDDLIQNTSKDQAATNVSDYVRKAMEAKHKEGWATVKPGGFREDSDGNLFYEED